VDIIGAASRLTRRLGGLVNSASVFSTGDLRDPAHFHSTLQINALAPLQLADGFRRRSKRGWIINITDAHIQPISLTYQNYRISKLLLTELTRQLAAVYAPAIRVNAIAPGAILPAPGASHRSFSRLAKEIPLKKTGDPAAVVTAFAYLLDNDYVTGETLYVDGGWHL
jgi:NAD(P)-dependent dehydrogenase (short-subunit alcohol dehydrogenase family)